MPLKTNVGVSRKIADNQYGSRGASVNLEVELDSSLVQEPERLQERIRQLFRLAQQSVDDELARNQAGNSTASHQTNGAANGHQTNGSNGTGHRISEKQLTFIRQLANAIKGLGVRRLDTLANTMFKKPLTDLSSLDGSGLIDVLKDVKAGKIDLENILSGGAA